MTHFPHPKFIVHCSLSNVSAGCADDGRIFDTSLPGTPRTSLHSLIDGDYLALNLRIPDDRRRVSVSLARVCWVQGSRFGVELLMMDSDERVRLNQFIDEYLPVELEFHDSQSELIIMAVEGSVT